MSESKEQNRDHSPERKENPSERRSEERSESRRDDYKREKKDYTSKSEIYKREFIDSSKRIWAGNLSFKTTKEDLVKEFSKFGKVVKMNLPYIDGKQKGYAFIEFETEKSAEEAIQKMDKTILGGREIKVELSGKPSRKKEYSRNYSPNRSPRRSYDYKRKRSPSPYERRRGDRDDRRRDDRDDRRDYRDDRRDDRDDRRDDRDYRRDDRRDDYKRDDRRERDGYKRDDRRDYRRDDPRD